MEQQDKNIQLEDEWCPQSAYKENIIFPQKYNSRYFVNYFTNMYA